MKQPDTLNIIARLVLLKEDMEQMQRDFMHDNTQVKRDDLVRLNTIKNDLLKQLREAI